MKYGETLRQRSIPAWSHHNIDYNDIKRIIKEQTTPGKGKTVSVPGRGDDKVIQFENSLFHELSDQHQRLDLFVRSKSGEIKRRLIHAQKQTKQLSARVSANPDQKIPVARLERYGKLENDVIKAGDEIKSLARFTSIQRTAFRKLLKKYKKWTGSTSVEDRFREEVLDDPTSFTKLDLGPLLDEYSRTLKDVRALYESRTQKADQNDARFSITSESSSIGQLQAALDSGSKAEFDTAMATAPLGEEGLLASYFVHPENVVELQMLLLQHWHYHSSRSRTNSMNQPISPSPRETPILPPIQADYFVLAADDPRRYVEEQNALTVDEREHVPGVSPQRARLVARWTSEEDPRISSRSASGKIRQGTIKKKQLDSFFDQNAQFPTQGTGKSNGSIEPLRKELEEQQNIHPMYRLSSCRSRFIGSSNSNKAAVYAMLDTNVEFQCAGKDAEAADKSTFPFAILSVRQEGQLNGSLLPALDSSHLLERVRGFTIEAHAVWETCKPSHNSPPIWLSVLSRDIRKLPPSTSRRNGSLSQGGSGSQSVTVGSSSTYNDMGVTDSTMQATDGALDNPPMRSFRKKRRRAYPEQKAVQQQRYWSEYDNPEDMSDGGGERDSYVLYIDPNEKSTFDKVFDMIGGMMFGRAGSNSDEEALPGSPGSPKDDESSSEDEETTALRRNRNPSTYGTLNRPRSEYMANPAPHETTSSPSPLTVISLVASLAILVTAYLLAVTGRRKLHYEVDAGIIFAMVCSLLFAITGCLSLLRQEGRVGWLTWSAASTVLLVDVFGTAGLLAWMLA